MNAARKFMLRRSGSTRAALWKPLGISSFRCDASVRGNAQTRPGLGAGVELERRPIEGLFEYRVGICGMEEREFGVAQSGGGVFALAQFAVKRVHQLRRGGVADFPQSADDIVRSGPQKGPREADQAFAGIGACARTIAGGNGHKVGVQAMSDDVSSIQLVSVASGFLAEDDRGIQRASAAGSSMRDEMEVREASGLAAQVRARRSLCALQNRAARLRRILFDLLHFGGGLGQKAKIGNGKRITDEKEILFFWRRARGGGRQQRQRARRGHDYILDPKMRPQTGHDQRSKLRP